MTQATLNCRIAKGSFDHVGGGQSMIIGTVRPSALLGGIIRATLST
jgi:hypothetical protein